MVLGLRGWVRQLLCLGALVEPAISSSDLFFQVVFYIHYCNLFVFPRIECLLVIY